MIKFDIKHTKNNFSLALKSSLTGGENLVVFGPSGSGKTSLLRCLAGFEQNFAGHVIVEDNIWYDSAKKIAKPAYERPIGYVFQHGLTLPHLNVKQHLLYAEKRTDQSRKKCRLNEVIEYLDLGGLLSQSTAKLSGGERQRLAIASAILKGPKLLLLDEPLASLDEAHKEMIMRYLKHLKELYPLTIIYVTHSIRELFSLASNVMILQKGKLFKTGTLETVCPYLINDAPHAGYLSWLSATVSSSNKKMCQVKVGKQYLEVMPNDYAVNESVRLMVSSRDIHITRQQRNHESMLGQLSAKVVTITPHRDGVHLTLDAAGHKLTAYLSRQVQNRIDLKAEESIFIDISHIDVIKNNCI